MHEFLHEVVWDGLLDTLKLVPFLFLTYLLMEWIEHRASARAARFMQRAGLLGPLVGGAVGAIPQCGFSSAAASLYTGRVITLGTLVAVLLSTSDEMLPILIGGAVPAGRILLILAYKTVVSILVGFLTDLVLRLAHRRQQGIDIDAICEEDNCHCERGILHSALHHTLTISLFILAMTLLLNLLIFFIGAERIGNVLNGIPVLSHLIAALFGLIPNCAASVVLSSFYVDGLISAGTMLAGLFSGAGVGTLVLFRVNRRHTGGNLCLLLLLVAVGLLAGLLADLTGLLTLLG